MGNCSNGEDQIFSLQKLISHLKLITDMDAKHRKVIYELIWKEGSSLQPVRLHHFPIIRSLLCPLFLFHSWLAKSPMTLCCCAAVLFWENIWQLGWDAVSWVSDAMFQCACTPSQHCLLVKQASPCSQNASFGVIWRKCSSARGDEWAVSIQSTFQKAAEAVILAGCHRD